MTIKEIAEQIGRQGTVRMKGLTVRVKILDARQQWGRVDYQITPVAGDGVTWVSAESVNVDK